MKLNQINTFLNGKLLSTFEYYDDDLYLNHVSDSSRRYTCIIYKDASTNHSAQHSIMMPDSKPCSIILQLHQDRHVEHS